MIRVLPPNGKAGPPEVLGYPMRERDIVATIRGAEHGDCLTVYHAVLPINGRLTEMFVFDVQTIDSFNQINQITFHAAFENVREFGQRLFHLSR